MNTTIPGTSNSLLIIFYRNPELGKVKTRLAATLGDSKALAVYLYLSAHTKSITESLPVDKAVFYSNHIDTEDNWDNAAYHKNLQSGTNLGERMANAFREGFRSGYLSICIVGTDCFELTSAAIEEAFAKLQLNDTVIGPANDGGYYLLGMNAYHAEFFENKSWSTSSVYEATLQDFKVLGLKYYKLPILTDIDEEKDLPEALKGLI
jgi:rSAM/selenodomain-associated transferase 1